MSSLKQTEASRWNGSKSQGPVTAQGKSVSSRNATTHGMYSRVIVLQNESHDLYGQLRESYLREWQPLGDRELHLVEDIVNARWRLNRIVAFETASLDLEMDRQRSKVNETAPGVDEATRATMAFRSLAEETTSLNLLQRYEGRLRRSIDRSSAHLERLQDRRRASSENNK